jgi:hypothetical protein
LALKLEIEKCLCLSQRKYCLELIFEFGLLAGKPSSAPIEPNLSVNSEANVNDPCLTNVTK